MQIYIRLKSNLLFVQTFVKEKIGERYKYTHIFLTPILIKNEKLLKIFDSLYTISLSKVQMNATFNPFKNISKIGHNQFSYLTHRKIRRQTVTVSLTMIHFQNFTISTDDPKNR